jgi:FeS assembly SUF system regulator
MLRLSRLCDYGVVLMAYLAAARVSTQSAQSLSAATGIPVPTVSKLLSTFARGGLLTAVRGARGGFRLAHDPQDISLTSIIGAIDGPIALTACLERPDGACEIESLCPSRQTWQIINAAVRDVLDRLTLADLINPHPSPFVARGLLRTGPRDGARAQLARRATGGSSAVNG